jgi:PAS domain S-box-containing protein
VRLAYSGRDAVNAVRSPGSEPAPELVLMDIHLPDVDGVEVARRILALRELPIVFLSAYGDEGTVSRARTVPSYGYVVKSSGEFVLLHAVETALSLFEQAHAGEHTRRLEEVELESEERRRYLEAVLASVPDAVFTSDPQHRIIEWNPGAEELFGYTAEEARGRDVDELITGPGGEVEEEARRISSEVTDELRIPRMEAIRYRKDGKPVHVLLSGAPIIVGEQIVGIVATYRDITRLKETERKLTAERERVEQLLEDRELMFKETRHRIKNDLALVRSLLSLHATQVEEETAWEALDEAEQRVGIISRLHELLFRTGEVESVPARGYLEDLVGELNSGPAPEGVEITLDAEDFSAPARLSVSLGIIMNELVTNTLKHASNGGTPATTQVALAVHTRSSDLVVLSYRDNGAGFPPEILQGDGGAAAEVVLRIDT